MTNIQLIDHAAAQAAEWVHALDATLETRSEASALAALRAVLHILRDRLSVTEAADLGAQLPTLIRGIYYEEYHPAGTPRKLRHTDEFLQAIGEKLHGHTEIDPESATRHVFDLISRKVSAGEVDDVITCMPRELRCYWPADLVARTEARAGQ